MLISATGRKMIREKPTFMKAPAVRFIGTVPVQFMRLL